jgi:hypothetical protein
MKVTLLTFIVTLIAAVLARILMGLVQKSETLFTGLDIQYALITAALAAVILPRVLRRS